jgi:hypothetical protein
MKNIAFMTILLVFLAGCNHLDRDENGIDVPTPNITPTELQDNLNKEIKTITSEANSIRTEAIESSAAATSIDISTTKPNVSNPQTVAGILAEANRLAKEIKESQNTILESAKELDASTKNLTRVDIELMGVHKYLNDVRAENLEILAAMETVKKENEELSALVGDFESGAKAAQQEIWMWIVGICALGLGVGVVLAIWVDPKLGVGVAAASLTVAAIAYFMAEYALIVACVGGCIFLGFIAYAISIFVEHKKALVESAMTVEMTKNGNWDEVKGGVQNVQSNSTRKLINEIKLKYNIGN